MNNYNDDSIMEVQGVIINENYNTNTQHTAHNNSFRTVLGKIPPKDLPHNIPVVIGTTIDQNLNSSNPLHTNNNFSIRIDSTIHKKLFVRSLKYVNITSGFCRSKTLYTFEIGYQRYVWTINKTHIQITNLYTQLRLLHPIIFGLNKIPTPEGSKRNLISLLCKYVCGKVSNKSLVMQELENCIDKMCEHDELFNSALMVEFLEIDNTCIPDQGRKGKAGWVYLTHYKYNHLQGSQMMEKKKLVWLVLTDTMILWYRGSKNPIGTFMIDKEFVIQYKDNRIYFQNGMLTMFFECANVGEWMEHLNNFYASSGRRCISNFGSVALNRTEISCKVYTISKDYFSSVAYTILSAQKEILICDWELSPTLHLCRPPLPSMRLDHLLQYKANQGVKIYILLYKEIEMALGNDSENAQIYLENLHPNISVIRHPNKYFGGSTAILWSHHDKLCVIDRSIAYVGGIDLAYGRYDDEFHTIVDELGTKFVGGDYIQPAKGLFKSVLSGNRNSNLSNVKSLNSDNLGDDDEDDDNKSTFSDITTSSSKSILDSVGGFFTTKIKDISNSVKISSEAKNKIIVPTRNTHPRSGWHDIQASVNGLVANDISLHIIQRWNHHRISTRQFEKEILVGSTDNNYFGICGRCSTKNIYYLDLVCPNCSYPLGPISSFYNIYDHFLPSLENKFNFMEYRITFKKVELTSFGILSYLNIIGSFPSLVQQISRSINDNIDKYIESFEILRVEGDKSNLIRSCAWFPQEGKFIVPLEGDVIVDINGMNVTHLDYQTLYKILMGIDSSITIIFRRHLIIDESVRIKTIQKIKNFGQMLSSTINKEEKKIETSTICKNASIAENLYSMSKFYYNIDNFECPKAHNPTVKGSCHVQMLRSVGPWSIGLNKEQSLMNCWCEEIKKSQHFIYIENQYFIGTSTALGCVPNAILQRLVMAYQLNQKFRVIIVLPQHPDGDFVNNMNPRFVLSYQQRTMYKGSQSLIQVFKQMCPNANPSDYIEFYCLRNWGILNNKFVTDQVYVHDKILIVDDRVAIIGSANINDRSMNGDRDTEVGIRIEDTNVINTCMAGNAFIVGVLPHNLRIKLMKQHIGVSISETDNLSDELFDPLSNGYKENSLWNTTANNNTKIYDDIDLDYSVYKCRTLAQYKQAFISHTNRAANDPAVIDAMNNIKGFLVHWPMDFLADDDLSPSIAQKLVMPVELWT